MSVYASLQIIHGSDQQTHYSITTQPVSNQRRVCSETQADIWAEKDEVARSATSYLLNALCVSKILETEAATKCVRNA